MIRKMPKWMAGVALALVAGAMPMACGGGGVVDEMAGASNDEDGSGGNDADGSGGGNTDGSGGSGDTDGSGGTDGGAGADGSGGTAPTSASIDDLIAGICAWEFGCCNEGELTYRLGTAAGSSEEDCVEFFTFQLHDSNVTSNPFPPGTTAQGLLGILGYTVDLTRVEENAAGIGECLAEYEDMACPEEFEAPTFCAEPVTPGAYACSLVNLFNPALEEGDRCTLGLAEGDGNDVECAAGTTCLPPGGDNPETFPICVQRGEADDPCTSDDDCDYNFYCAPDSDCTEKGDAGDDCTFNDDDPLPNDEDAGCKAGLKCDPVDLVCVNNCTENYPCDVNTECPEDFVCAPVTVGSDSTNWSQCVPAGESAENRCDEDADCADDRYCDGSVCQGDVDIGDACDKSAMCEAGSFCDLNYYGGAQGAYRVASETCVAYYQAGETCLYPTSDGVGGYMDTGCSPDAPLCLYDSTDAQWECTDELYAAGDDCFDMVTAGLPSECGPGLACETTDETATWVFTCTAGAEADDDCDTDVLDDADQDCGSGLTCKDAVCLAQLDSGEDCESTDTPGTGDSTLCKNGQCVDNWDENGPDWICSDAPVPESNGGDNLTCGG